MSYSEFKNKWNNKVDYTSIGAWPNRITGIALKDKYKQLQDEFNEDWKLLSYDDRILFIKGFQENYLPLGS